MNVHSAKLVAVLGLMALAPLAAAKEPGLDRWFDDELLPYLGRQLSEHPRFKGETLMFVVFDDGGPTALGNALTLALRDRMLDAARDLRGVRIGWLQESGLDSGAVDCSRDDVHYFIGIELSRRMDGRYTVELRAQDVEDRSWVSGFAKRWRGRLDRAQQQAALRAATDASFLGAREAPFTLAQVDLLARRLAHDLSCELTRQTYGEYVVTTQDSRNGVHELDAAVEMIGNYIAAHPSVAVTANDEQVNAELAGKAFQIDGSLHQFWLRVAPNGRDAGLEALSASAYVVLPDSRAASAASSRATAGQQERRRTGRATPGPLSIPRSQSLAMIGALRIADPADDRQCGPRSAVLQAASYQPGRRQCSLLAADLHANAVVFVVQHQAQLGLVRPGGDECRPRTRASVVRRGETLRFPIASFRAETGELRETDAWHVAPQRDTYYAIAVTDSKSARRLANHIDRLPMRCGERARPGLRNREARAWLDELALLATQFAGHIDWRALEVKNIY